MYHRINGFNHANAIEEDLLEHMAGYSNQETFNVIICHIALIFYRISFLMTCNQAGNSTVDFSQSIIK
uniref:Uncharacterized protein n=1 Tax=Ciona intestinalis TaxID=7719 RepID=H2XMC5_CIOIN